MAITFGANLSGDDYWNVPEFAWRAEGPGSLISISSSSSKVKKLVRHLVPSILRLLGKF